ncbi:helix-turn-helix domain-containing protein [Nocardioides sp. 1609]|uniref:helix-turn-helix domain-containing protein n=1 Tax=Nocardioides sp. 1609 TaxID=2508327 RepID=UPI0010705472|nr:helix-turn-helix domain-containing protein [Nocardioides sp. 1609]
MSGSGDPAWEPGADDLRILALLAEGQTVGSVSRRSGLSERTVRRRLRALADDLGVDSTIETVVHAVRLGLI